MKIVEKRGWFWIGLHWLVVVFTFGQNRKFLTNYLTTIGPLVGVPVGFKADHPGNRAILAHEACHVLQQERLGLGSAWVGLVPWGLVWLLFPLPLGLAFGRYWLEREAYAVGIRMELEMYSGGTSPRDSDRELRAFMIDHAVAELTSGAYGWAWPFPAAVRAYFNRTIP